MPILIDAVCRLVQVKQIWIGQPERLGRQGYWDLGRREKANTAEAAGNCS